eukprot:TRINITY_DN14812_c0_g1_i1.p2 TRINITY_DN14812_c0_g1~~TRINITY_DN14812_c0_g1_i1.p2  ORF type:complete len:175 (+),score=42.84 TRINITY_DN14812_c0_g1_i1:296-820(+)
MLITVLGQPDPRYQAAIDSLAGEADITLRFVPVLSMTSLAGTVLPVLTAQDKPFDAMVVTSKHAAQVLDSHWMELGCPSEAHVVGGRTAEEVEHRQFGIASISDNMHELVEAVACSGHVRLLRLCSLESIGNDRLAELLNQKLEETSGRCECIAVYSTQPVPQAGGAGGGPRTD